MTLSVKTRNLKTWFLLSLQNKEGKIDLSNNDKAFDLLDKQQRIHEVVVAAKGTQPALHEQHDLFQEIHEVHQN